MTGVLDAATGLVKFPTSRLERALRGHSNPIAFEPSELDPCDLADFFADLHHADHFARWRGDWYRYVDDCYRPISTEEVEALARQFLRRVVVRTEANGEIRETPYGTSIRKTRELVAALAARPKVLLRPEIAAPFWREGQRPAEDTLVMLNGPVHLAERLRGQHSPSLFALDRVDYEWTSEPGDPEAWFEFLDSLWPDDEESQQALAELAGLLLTRDTRYQKIFLFVGPKRSGKGTIFRIFRKLIGEASCVAPTLGSLTTSFGLAGWLNAKAALISDARLSGRTDQAQVVEKLLTISGEDPVDVNRKYRDQLSNIALPTRILIASNELPRLSDASGALASRFVVFRLTRSFLGQEDHDLEAKLAAELPDILHWALDGLESLRRRGRILQPETGRKAIVDLEDLASPVAAFAREELTLERGKVADPGSIELWGVDDGGPWIRCNELYARFKTWSEDRGWSRVATAPHFGRDLMAAFPEVSRGRKRIAKVALPVYRGIAVISEDAREAAE